MKTTIAAAQYPITEHKSFDDWHQHTADWIAQAAEQGAQLLLFPEYGSMELVSIFPQEIRDDIQRQVLELQRIKDQFCAVFAEQAKKWNVIVVAPSFPVLEEGNVHNRVWVFSAKGLVGFQDKFFMTRFENEIWGIKSAPKVLTLFEAPWGSFGVQICYDVEFSLGSQLLSGAGASLILSPSCTDAIRGSSRVHIAARARALESQAFTVVSQTVGDAPWSPAVDINYGYTAYYCTPDLHFPEEGIVNSMTPQTAGWLVQELDFSSIELVRNTGKVFNHKDHQRYQSKFHDEDITLLRKQV